MTLFAYPPISLRGGFVVTSERGTVIPVTSVVLCRDPGVRRLPEVDTMGHRMLHQRVIHYRPCSPIEENPLTRYQLHQHC